MLQRTSAIFLVACVLAVAPAQAASQRLQIDRSASKVAFTAKATMHSFDGWIDTWDLDLQIPEGAELPDVVVFTGNGASMTTDHTKRDTEMHHWMEHEKLPEIAFRLARFTGSADARVAEGELTLHGVSVPVSMPVKLERSGDTLTVDGEALVNVTNFGLPQFRKFGMLTVAPEVKVTFHVTGKLE